MDAKRHTEVYHFLFEATVARRGHQREEITMTHGHDGEAPSTGTCARAASRRSPLTKIDVIDVAKAVEADKLTEADVFKRTYLGHGTQSSVFVFQGHAGPFRSHVHVTHDEIGYVLEGSGSVTVGGVTRPVKPGDVWVIPANTPHGGQFDDAAPGAVHLVADRRPGQPGPGVDRLTIPDGYEALEASTVEAYLDGRPELRARLAAGPLTVREVGDGNLNLVFIVRSAAEPECRASCSSSRCPGCGCSARAGR